MAKPDWTDGNCRIYKGDCLDILGGFPENSVSLVLTDPPYGIDYQAGWSRTIKKKIKNDNGPFSYIPWASLCFDLLKNNTALFAYTGWSVYHQHFQDLRHAGFELKEPLIIQKRLSGGLGDLEGTFKSSADWVLFAHKGKFKFKPNTLLPNERAGKVPNPGRKPTPRFATRLPAHWFGNKFPYSTENPGKLKNNPHPTVKTVEVMKWLITLATKPGDIVLDPFLGSGTVLMACKETGRRGVGIELDEVFFELAVKRVASHRKGFF